MSTVKIPGQELRNSIVREEFNDRVYHYTLCKKQGANISFLSNERLIIYDETGGCLFYVNQTDCVPFKGSPGVPVPKKQIAYLNSSIITKVANEPTLSIQFNVKGEKNENVTIVWHFTMSSIYLTNQWLDMLKNEKSKRISSILSIKDKKQAQTVGDALSFAMVSPQKKAQGTQPMDETEKKDQSMFADFLMKSGNKNSASNLKQPQGRNQHSMFRETTSELEKSKDPLYMNESLNNGSVLQNSKSKMSQIQQNSKSKMSQIQQANTGQSKIHAQMKDSKSIAISRLGQTFPPKGTLNQSNIPKSEIRSVNQSNLSGRDNWNIRFLNSLRALHNPQSVNQSQQIPPQRVLFDFQQYATKMYNGLQQEQLYKNIKSNNHQIHKAPIEQLEMFYCLQLTAESQKLRNQFYNNHYLLEKSLSISFAGKNTKNSEFKFIGVPLCALIRRNGLVCLMKARLPENSPEVSSNIDLIFKRIESLTKISSGVLRKNGKIVDVTNEYGNNQLQEQLYYVDNLEAFLPEVEIQGSITQLRAEFFGNKIKDTLEADSTAATRILSMKMEESITEAANVLSEHDTIFCHYSGLDSFLNSFGLCMNQLPQLYPKIKNKQMKKYIHSVMISRLFYEQITQAVIDQNLADTLLNHSTPKIVEEMIKVICEGESPISHESWKSMAVQFKKRYRTVMNPHEIESGFFFSSLLALLDCYEYDMDKIDRTKNLLQSDNIFTEGFVTSLKTRCQVYEYTISENIRKGTSILTSFGVMRQKPRFNTHSIDLKAEQELNQLKKLSYLDNRNSVLSYMTSQTRQRQFYSHLSPYIPFNTSSETKVAEEIYQFVNHVPPTLSTHIITMSFLKTLLHETKQIDDYKLTIENALQILTYYCGADHLLLCDIFESLSDYYQYYRMNHEDSINFMKQSLTTCIRSGGTSTRQAGIKYYLLGDRLMSLGYCGEALDNLLKSKNNMESFLQKGAEYPLMLNKLAILYLNKGEIKQCVSLTMKALKTVESLEPAANLEIDDGQLIKNYELLCRAYEVDGEKEELSKLSHLTAKVFNNTKDPYAFDQMIKICMTATIANMTRFQLQKLSEYVAYIRKNEAVSDTSRALLALMNKAHTCIVMEKLIEKIKNIDKLLVQASDHKKSQNPNFKEAKWFVDHVINCVGKDFVEGILVQNSFA